MSALLPLMLAIPALGCVVLLALPRRNAGPRAVPIGIATSGATLLVACIAAVAADPVDTQWIPALDVRFHLGVDGVSAPLVVLTAALTFLCLVYSARIMPVAGRPRAFVALLLLLEVGMLGTFVALDLILFFVFFEVVLLPMWFLIAVWGTEGRVAAANKFILFTLLGSAFVLVGFLLVYAKTGTFDMVELAARGGDGISGTTQALAFVALAVGFGVKAPMWPLHTWLPDAHTAAPTVGSVLLAGVLLKMGTYGLVRTGIFVLPDGARDVAPYLGAFAVVGIIWGSLACLAQRDLKRLIAFSSVGHMGFVLLGIATMTTIGVNGALYANIAHGLITGLLFFLAGAIKDRHHTSDLAELGHGLYTRLPRLGALLGFAAIASLGLPGLAGFWGELLALLGAYQPDAELQRELFVVLMAIAGLGTVLTAAYFLMVLRRLGQGVPSARWQDAALLGDASTYEIAVWTPLVAAIVVLGLWPGALLAATDPVVSRLVGGG